MKTWHIWDFPDNIYIYLNDNFRDDFFNNMFKKIGGKRPYARFLGLGQMTVKSYHRGHFYKNGIKYLQSIPISLFKKSLNLIDGELKQRLENNIYFIKAHGKSIPVLNPNLPISESSAFYRIVAHMIGDGSAPKSHPPYYANTCKELREQFKEDLKIFGDVKVYETKTTTTPIVCFPKVITDILAHILDVRFTYPDRIPKYISYASNDSKVSFLRALFDDEGTISTNLAISMNNHNLVEQIRELVNSIGVSVNKLSIKKDKLNDDNYYFSIKSKSFGVFRDKIGFSHPKKSKNLEAAVNIKHRKQRTRPVKIINQNIIKILSEKQRATIDLANELQFTLSYTLFHLKRLEKERLVKRSGFKNKLIWSLT